MAGFGSLIPGLSLDDLQNGLVNGARSFGDQAKWALGGMNGPQPSAYTGGSTANQYVDQHWPVNMPAVMDDNAGYINPVTGDYMTPAMVQKQGQMAQGFVSNKVNGLLSLPQRAIEASKQDASHFMEPGYQPQAIGPSLETAMMMMGRMPAAEAGTLGVGGGALRNKFTGQFMKEGQSPLPGNPYRSVNTQAKPVAVNSAEAQARYGFPGGQTPIDPALLDANLARIDNPMVQQVPAQVAAPQAVVPAARINPADVDYWKSRMSNGFGSLITR
jgi:hypothetical protein